MQLLNTQSVSNWPEDVLLGFSEIREKLGTGILSAEEEDEYQKFGHEGRKAEFLTGRHLFRLLLKRAGLDSGNVQLCKEPDGKPYAEAGKERLFVSFSHTGSLVFCALSAKRDIGMDAEETDREVSDRLLNRILNEAEKEQLSGADPLMLWTIKEAAVKKLGTGLRTNLNELKIEQKGADKYGVRINDEINYEICNFRQLNHQIAIAY